MSAVRRHWGAAGMVVGAIITASGMSASAAYAATTYTVNNTAACSDAGPGTPTQPLCTIGAAAAKAVAGDTVRVTAGTYRGRR